MNHQTLFIVIVIVIVIIEALLHVIPVVRDIPVDISTPNQSHTYSSQGSNKTACTSNALPPTPMTVNRKKPNITAAACLAALPHFLVPCEGWSK